MRSTIAKSVFLSVLAAATTTSSVFAVDIDSQRIVGGNQADPGDYPYFGE
jgi:secreted trypsin-like serine protease